MAEQLSNLGYIALKKQTNATTAIIPDDYLPAYSESITTFVNLDEDTAVVGHKAARHQLIQGQRHHMGDFTVLAEPNTTGRIMDMTFNKVSTTGAGPYTHTFALNSTTPNSYTMDVAKGRFVHRFIGVQASKVSPSFDKNKMLLNVSVSALKSFLIREISSVTGSGPYTVNFTTGYDPSPTDGLVVGDLIRFYSVAGDSYIDATVASIPGVTSITTSTNVSTMIAGDLMGLRPATVTLTNRQPFLWSKTQFQFGADATAALAASQVRVEQGSDWTLMHNFESNEGAKRSGGLDPAALVRTTGDAELKTKTFFETSQGLNRYQAVTKRASVIRHYSETTTYELRVTLNNLKIAEGNPHIDTGKIIYHEEQWKAQYDVTDAQMFNVVVINNLATI